MKSLRFLLLLLLLFAPLCEAQWLTSIKSVPTNTGATVTWTSAVPASSRVKYGPTSTYGSESAPASTLVTTHSVVLTGLTASTLYHFAVQSNDSLGIGVTSQDLTFTTTTTAIGTLSASPTSLAFGNVAVGSVSAIRLTTLTNTGNAPLTIDTDSIVGTGYNWGGTGTCNDNTLAPAASCTMSATFTPTAVGAVSGSLTISSTASDATLVVPLTGTGTAATAYSVNLSWIASTTSGVNYTVYRSPTPTGTYTAIVSGLTALTYTDTTVVAGQNYSYEIKATLNGVASTTASNVATVTIP